jgi:hypothetical protein
MAYSRRLSAIEKNRSQIKPYTYVAKSMNLKRFH